MGATVVELTGTVGADGKPVLTAAIEHDCGLSLTGDAPLASVTGIPVEVLR